MVLVLCYKENVEKKQVLAKSNQYKKFKAEIYVLTAKESGYTMLFKLHYQSDFILEQLI